MGPCGRQSRFYEGACCSAVLADFQVRWLKSWAVSSDSEKGEMRGRPVEAPLRSRRSSLRRGRQGPFKFVETLSRVEASAGGPSHPPQQVAVVASWAVAAV